MAYFILFFSSTFLVGFTAVVLTYRPVHSKNLPVLYGSIAVGNTLSVFLLNGLCYGIGVEGGMWAAPAMGFAVFALAWMASGKFREEAKAIWRRLQEKAGAKRNQQYGVLVAGILTVGFLAAIAFFATRHDAEAHHAQLATISMGNFPVMFPFQPDLFLSYHYGFSLFAAFPFRATFWDINIVEDLCLTWIMLGAVLSVVNFVKVYFSARRKAQIMGLLFYFFGYGPLGICGLLYFTGFFLEWLPEVLGPISVLSYSNSFLRRAPAMAYAVLPTFLWMLHRFWDTRKSWPAGQALLLAGIMASFGLLAEEVSIITGAAIILVGLKDWLKGHMPLTKVVVLGAFLLLSLLLCMWQGGMPTYAARVLFQDSGELVPTMQSVKHFNMIWPPGVPAYTGYGHAFSPTFWRVLLLEFGPLFLLFPYFLWPGRDSFRQLVYTMCWIGLLVPAFLTWEQSTFNMQRFSQISLYLAYLFAGRFLADALKARIASRRLRTLGYVALAVFATLTPVLHGAHRIAKKQTHVTVAHEAEAIVQDAKMYIPPLSRVVTLARLHYPLHREGYFALYDTPPDLFYLTGMLRGQHDASLAELSREKCLDWRPDFLLVPFQAAEHFQKTVPESRATPLRTYLYKGKPLHLIKIDFP